MNHLFFPAPFLGCILRIAADFRQLEDRERAFYCIKHSEILAQFSKGNCLSSEKQINDHHEPISSGVIWAYAISFPSDHDYASCGIINMHRDLDYCHEKKDHIVKFLAELVFILVLKARLFEIDMDKARKPLDHTTIDPNFIGRCFGFSKAVGRWSSVEHKARLESLFQSLSSEEFMEQNLLEFEIKPNPRNLPDTLTDIVRLYPTFADSDDLDLMFGIYMLISDILFYDLARMP